MRGDDLVLDGNAVAGLLEDILAFDMTTARTICASCGAERAMGALRVYVNAPGAVVRCVDCDSVQLRVVIASDERYWLDIRGVSCVVVGPTHPSPLAGEQGASATAPNASARSSLAARTRLRFGRSARRGP
jgi:hypothetical protein